EITGGSLEIIGGSLEIIGGSSKVVVESLQLGSERLSWCNFGFSSTEQVKFRGDICTSLSSNSSAFETSKESFVSISLAKESFVSTVEGAVNFMTTTSSSFCEGFASETIESATGISEPSL